MVDRRFTACALAVLVLAGSVNCGPAGAQSQAELSVTPLSRPDAIELRRVFAGSFPNFYPSNPSPDGTLISEIDWSTGDLAVIDLEAGRLRRVTDKGPWSVSGDYAEFSVFSPDGQRMAYSWFSSESRGYQVRTIRLDGTDMRVVFPKKADVAYVAVEDWSRDATSLLVIVFRTDRSTQLGVVSVVDGSYRALKTNDWRAPSVLTFSPDGRFVAYDLARSTERSERDIFVLAADGSREVMVVGGADDNRLLGWLPDGSGILYHRRAGNESTVMALAVRDGRTVGRPQLVRPDISQMVPLGFSRDAYFYGVQIERPHVHVASVDLSAGRMVTPPVSFADPVEGATHDSAWSPDGQTVAYLVDAPGGARMILRSVSGEFRRQIQVPLSEARKTNWAPDASAVYVFGTDVEGRVGIHRVDVRSGAVTPVVARGPGGEAEGMAFWDLSPDGRTIYHRRAKVSGEQHLMFEGTPKPTQDGHVIVAVDIASGETKELAEVPPGRVLSVSPDGQWLAVHAMNPRLAETSVLLMPSRGGPTREVYRNRGGQAMGNRSGLEWAPDGRSILYYYAPKEGPGGIWQLPVDGGEPRLVVDTKVIGALTHGEHIEARNYRLSPDGRQLVFETGRSRAEIWMMSGFPAAAGK